MPSQITLTLHQKKPKNEFFLKGTVRNEIFLFQYTGWNAYHRRPCIYPGSDEWPRAQSYEKTEKWEYGFHANMDMEKDTKIKISTPLRYG